MEIVQVPMHGSTYNKLKDYSERMNVTPAQALAEAITDFLETTGAARIAAQQPQTIDDIKNKLVYLNVGNSFEDKLRN